MQQQSIKKEIFLEGIGVHNGKKSSIRLKPAPVNHGITLVNTKLPQNPIIIGSLIPEPAMHATVIKQHGWSVSTIEHLMAAICGLAIDNLIIEIDGAEIPIFDGSALPFVQAFETAGIEKQNETKKFLTPYKPLHFQEEKRFLEIIPAQNNNFTLSFEYSIDFEHPLVQNSSLRGKISSEYFTKEIAPARTFGFLEQLPLLRQYGLAQGTTLGNTVVVGEEAFLNNLRFKNEFIRHKLLDLLGDLALLGKPLIGTIKAYKTGHTFNRKVIEHFVLKPNEWRII